MTPELKQDLDSLFAGTAVAVQDLHDKHQVQMGTMLIDIDYDTEPCEGCTCGLAEEPALLKIETLDDFDTTVSAIVEAFEETVVAAKDDLMHQLEDLGQMSKEAGLNEQLLAAIFSTRFASSAQRLEEAFQV